MANAKDIWNKAKEAIQSSSRLGTIMDQARNKLSELDGERLDNDEAIGKIKTLIHMLKSYLKGDRDAFSTRTLVFITFALLYFVIPTDAVPDFLPALGFTDDISILYFVYKQINTDVERFLQRQA